MQGSQTPCTLNAPAHLQRAEVKPGARGQAGALLALSLLWGSSWIGNELVRHQAGPLHLVMLRDLLACACLTCAIAGLDAVARLRKQTSLLARSKATSPAPSVNRMADSHFLWPNILLGLSLFALPDLLLVVASAHGAGAWTPQIYACMPLGLALAEGELSTAAIVGPCAMLVLLNGSLSLAPATLAWTVPIATAVALQGWSLRFIQRNLGAVTRLSAVLVQLATASAALRVALLLIKEPAVEPLPSWPASSIAALCSLAALATALAYPLLYGLLRTLSPAQVATSQWVQPLVALSESALVLRLRPSLPMILAASVLVICSLTIVRGPEPESGKLLYSDSV